MLRRELKSINKLEKVKTRKARVRKARAKTQILPPTLKAVLKVKGRVKGKGKGMLKNIVADLETIDSIRCFFAVLFLARDKKIEIEQQDDDIEITLIESTKR